MFSFRSFNYPAMDNEQQARPDRNGARLTGHLIAHAACFIGIKCFLVKRPLQVCGVHFRDRTLPGNQRDNVTAPAMDLDPVPAKQNLLHPIVEPNVASGEAKA
jgi:hypothetical protein